MGLSKPGTPIPISVSLILGLVDPIRGRVPLAPHVTASDCSVPLAGAVAPPVASEACFLVITGAIMKSQ